MRNACLLLTYISDGHVVFSFRRWSSILVSPVVADFVVVYFRHLFVQAYFPSALHVPVRRHLSIDLPVHRHLSTDLPVRRHLSTDLPVHRHLSTDLPVARLLLALSANFIGVTPPAFVCGHRPNQCISFLALLSNRPLRRVPRHFFLPLNMPQSVSHLADRVWRV